MKLPPPLKEEKIVEFEAKYGPRITDPETIRAKLLLSGSRGKTDMTPETFDAVWNGSILPMINAGCFVMFEGPHYGILMSDDKS